MQESVDGTSFRVVMDYLGARGDLDDPEEARLTCAPLEQDRDDPTALSKARLAYAK